MLDSSSFSSHQSSSFNQNSFCNSVYLSKKDHWHCRLGHPSFVKIHNLRNELNIKENFVLDDFHCSTRHFVKQRRLPFISSNNLCDKPFQLIHFTHGVNFTHIVLKVLDTFLPLLMKYTVMGRVLEISEKISS